VRITFPQDVLKQVPLRSGLSVIATIHTRDAATPEPTLLGALGLEAFATRSLKP
jgi:multidrug resistance efflux pump